MKKAVIAAPKRANNNYRYYDDQALQQLIFIRHCRELGMSLKEIQEMNELMQHPQDNCAVVDNWLKPTWGIFRIKFSNCKNLASNYSSYAKVVILKPVFRIVIL
jgi:DNA-binding transcriptional MerR regulator